MRQRERERGKRKREEKGTEKEKQKQYNTVLLYVLTAVASVQQYREHLVFEK